MENVCAGPALAPGPGTAALQPAAGNRGGFTLLEALTALSVFAVAMAGAFAVYISCHSSWASTTLALGTASETSAALERMVYGVGTNSGLRASQENTVNVTYPGGGWRIEYDGSRFLQYAPLAQTITDESGEVLCRHVLTSSLVETNSGCAILVAVSDSAGRRAATNVMSTFVYFRN